MELMAWYLVFGLVLLVAAGTGPDHSAVRSRIGVGLGHLAIVVAAVVAAALLAPVPAGLVGYLGFYPLLRGLNRVSSMRFRGPPWEREEAPEASAGSWVIIARQVIAGGGDLLAVSIPLFASRTAGEVAVLAPAIVAAGLAGSLAPGRSDRAGRAWPRLAGARPWLMVAVGAYVLVDGGAFNWLLPGR
jgi:cadmium resistance protein CadD (predicted permease)